MRKKHSILLLFLFVTIFADFWAGSLPLAAVYKDATYFPLFRQYASYIGISVYERKSVPADWRTADLSFSVFPLVPYDPTEHHLADAQLVPPFSDVRHLLGTDHLGRDVLSGLIHGCRYSMGIAFAATFISGILGIFIGTIAGYWGDDRLKTTVPEAAGVFWGTLLGIYYGLYLRQYKLADALEANYWFFLKEMFISIGVAAVLTAGGYRVGKVLNKIKFLSRKFTFPTDTLISRFTEIPLAVPVFMFLMTLTALLPPGTLTVIFILGFLQWMPIATLTRAEVLKIKSFLYVQAAESAGLSQRKIIFNHILPAAWPSVSVLLAYTAAGSILAESALSFLGIGLSPETVTWGGMLTLSKSHVSAWWLAVFPGLLIFLMIQALNGLRNEAKGY